MPHLKLKLNGIGHGKVIIDGQEIDDCVQIRLDGQAGEMTKVTLTLLARSVEVDAMVDLEVATPPSPQDSQSEPGQSAGQIDQH